MSPDLLMDGLTLIGRQVSTDGGPLDLLGIDADGRLVVFELKRGTLTRDAVAQVLDYASGLATLDTVRFGALIEKHSGRHGVDRIELASENPCRRHRSFTGRPASASRRNPMICASVNRFFTSDLPFRMIGL